MEKTKKIITTVAAVLVVLAGGLGVGYKIWFNEDMPTVEGELVVVDSVVVDSPQADTVVLPATDTVAE